jgi:hypothetical protein
MSVPTWWSDSLLEPGDSSISISDVETGGVGIITEARLRLVTNGNWTEPSTALFKTPSTSAGVWFDVLMTRIDADTMEYRVRNHLGQTLMTRRCDIEAAGNTTVNFYWGNSYLIIITRRATPEPFVAAILDPEIVGATDAEQTNRVVCNAYRLTAGTAQAAALQPHNFFAMDSGVATNADRFSARWYSTAGSLIVFPGLAGRELYTPPLVHINQGGTRQWTGTFPGTVYCADTHAVDTVKNIPVDTGTKKAFIVLPFTAIATYGGKMGVRKPSVDP